MSSFIFVGVVLAFPLLWGYHQYQKKELEFQKTLLQKELDQIKALLEKQNQEIARIHKRLEALEAIAVTPQWENALRALPLTLSDSEKAQLLAHHLKSQQT
ncbi:MAG: hypothetical protein ACUVRD_07305 [Bacteroidia bacterium]